MRPSKHRGQNFVVDPGTVRRIVRVADPAPDDVVLEVGPGLGSLTLALLPRVRRLVAVEVDPLLAGALSETVAARRPDLAGRLEVLTADALDLPALPAPAQGGPTLLVANLPYNVAVPVLLTALERQSGLRRVLVMVQSEVADRLVAGPGSRTYGVPSVKTAWWAEATRAGSVGRRVFWPVPNVDSALVAMRRREPPASRAGRAATFAVVDAAFSQRRKTLRAALARWAGDAATAETVLRRAGVDPATRGERLGITDFARIADAGLALPGR